jgi:hypothetical protein
VARSEQAFATRRHRHGLDARAVSGPDPGKRLAGDDPLAKGYQGLKEPVVLGKDEALAVRHVEVDGRLGLRLAGEDARVDKDVAHTLPRDGDRARGSGTATTELGRDEGLAEGLAGGVNIPAASISSRMAEYGALKARMAAMQAARCASPATRWAAANGTKSNVLPPEWKSTITSAMGAMVKLK